MIKALLLLLALSLANAVKEVSFDPAVDDSATQAAAIVEEDSSDDNTMQGCLIELGYHIFNF